MQELWHHFESRCKWGNGRRDPGHFKTPMRLQTGGSTGCPWTRSWRPVEGHILLRHKQMDRLHVGMSKSKGLYLKKWHTCIKWWNSLGSPMTVCGPGPNTVIWGEHKWPSSSILLWIYIKNEKNMKAYLDNLEKYFKDHKICEHIDKLIKDAPGLSRNDIKWWYEGIDNDMMWGMISSEKKIKAKTFKYEWSSKLDAAGYCVWYWRIRLSDMKNNSSS